ncbi:MAG: GNAT family N-acetyltransferase [Chloroflexi bacterium]|jgi:RimJ/RimL family protein N-acetyltransferase|nr:GNAT family N-acetyltransferase [Chloroflexota bacterium]
MPILYGENVRLRATERTDIPVFQRWINDPEVTEYLSNIFPYSLEAETAWYESILKRPMAEHPLVIDLSLTQGNTGKPEWLPIGNCAFMHITDIHRSAEVGIFLGEKEYWSQGYGTEAMRLMLKFGFEDLNFYRIWLRVLESNHRARKSYLKSGFIEEGRFRKAEFRHGFYNDIILMSILQEEWFANKQKKG